jgi:protein translocase SecG subunit
MKNILNIVIAISSVFTILAVILQQKGSGLSGVFGGSDVSYMTKRGAEKFLVVFTIISATVLCISALLILFV